MYLRGLALNTVLREEKKYLISVEECLKKKHTLETVMRQDSHNGKHGYRIRSLYFDTAYDQDYFDKLDSIEHRKKIRLRCYNSNADYALLEMKQKQGVYQKKRSLRVSRDDAISLIDGNYSPLLNYSDDFAQECYGLMKSCCYLPKTIVEYNRKAFVAKENKIRITFDSNVISTESNFDLFSPNLLMNPVLDTYIVILEVKYNGFLISYIRDILNSIDKNELSVSKYYLARLNAYQAHL